MNSTKKSLEHALNSYNLLISLLVIFIILMFILFQTNVKGFNKVYGYEVFITGPILLLIAFLIKEFYAFKINPQSSWLSSFTQSKENWFLPVYILSIGLLGIFGLFMLLYIGGIFSDNPPENNTAMIMNFVIIFSFIVIASLLYQNSREKDNNILFTQSKAIRDLFELRTKYTILFAAFVLLVMILYFINPWGLMTNYGGPTIFFTLFVGMILVTMIIIYQNKLATGLTGDYPSPFSFIYKSIYVLGALAISFGLIYGALKLMGVFDQDKTTGQTIFNFILFTAMLGIIYKLLNAGGFLTKNPYFSLIANTLLFIPCIFSNIISALTPHAKMVEQKPYEIKLLIISLILLVGYFSWTYYIKHFIVSKYLKQGGKQLINQPIQTNVLTNVTSYQNLTGDDKYDYQYALSFWVYLDAFSPIRQDDMINILSNGDNPAIKYSTDKNTLYVTVKNSNDNEEIVTNVNGNDKEWNLQNRIDNAIENIKNTFKDETDSQGNRILFKLPNVKLQKWNHILLNYNGGTLDIFYNGKLVKSAIKVVPYINYDMLTIGSENGVSGNIANLMYFDSPLKLFTIDTLYSSLKDKNPPVIP